MEESLTTSEAQMVQVQSYYDPFLLSYSGSFILFMELNIMVGFLFHCAKSKFNPSSFINTSMLLHGHSHYVGFTTPKGLLT
jgi:hypothetical protein